MNRVVIVGGGFAGLNAARLLAKSGNRDLQITLVDRRNHHLFQPLLYQVAMAGLSPADIASPIRKVLSRYRNVDVKLADVTRIDLKSGALETTAGSIPYDHLILACGATHAYFGNDEWEQHAPGLKTLEQATEIRRRVLTAFEEAELESDPKRRKELLTFVVVGGGPTGVELAGALGEISRFTLQRDFRNIDPSRTFVMLIEAGPRVLPSFSESLSQEATRSLEKLGVAVRTDSKVTKITEDGVELDDESIRAATVLWAAGVQASPLNQQVANHTGLKLDRAGRLPVAPDLSVPNHPSVFIVGDQARVEQENGDLVPGVAPAAIQMGKHAAESILADLKKTERQPFKYFDKGQMATIGRACAVAETGGFRLSGLMAWLAWCFVHILYLVGFRNRALVLMQWSWSYFRFRRGARLILGQDWRLDPETKRGEHSPDVPESAPTDSAPASSPDPAPVSVSGDRESA